MKFWALFLLLLLGSVAATATPIQINGGRIVDLKDGSQLIFNLTGAVTPEAFLLDNPPRFVIDLRNTTLLSLQRNLRSTDVRGVRTGSHNGRDLRIVVDLLQPIYGKTTLIKDASHRLVVDFFRNRAGQAVNAKSGSTEKPVATKPTVKIPAIALVAKPDSKQSLKLIARSESKQSKPSSASKPTAKPQQTATKTQTKPKPTAKPQQTATKTQTKPKPTAKPQQTATKTQTKPKPSAASKPKQPASRPAVKRKRRDIVIAIDAGHGGKDSGAIGPSGTKEKQVTLQIAKRLHKMINETDGMRAFLTRNGDYYLRLRRRIAIARKKKADLFISIHADAYPAPDPRGASVFMLSTKGASSTMARWLAESENKSDLIDEELEIDDPRVRQIVFDMEHDAILADSKTIAEKTLRELKKIGQLHSRRVERANFAVLKSPDIPSILVETAFISNPTEERKLRSKRYQTKLAKAILKGAQAYLAERPQLGVKLVEMRLEK